VKWGLKTSVLGRDVISYKKVDSTNTIAYSLAENGSRDGLVVLSEEQTKGKGRLGRSWASPPKGGVYMSCMLKPDITPREIPRITLLAAVAVTEAIRDFTGLPAMIKWPNDVLINDRKVCGILTEMKAEQDGVAFVIVGIGVNVNTSRGQLPAGGSSLKEELKRISRRDSLSRLELVRKMLERLDEEYARLKEDGFAPIIERWRHLSAMLGSRVKVSLHDGGFAGVVHDMDADGSLVVRLESGFLKTVSSGDVTMVR